MRYWLTVTLIASATIVGLCFLAERDMFTVTSCWVLGCFGCFADFASDEVKFRKYQQLEADRRLLSSTSIRGAPHPDDLAA